MADYKIAVIGAGNMGGSIVRGLWGHPYSIAVSNPHEDKLKALSEACPGISTYTDNRQAVVGADLVILAVKPYFIEDVIAELLPVLDLTHTAIASLAAPQTLADLDRILGYRNAHILKIIPNTAISVGRGITFISTLNVPDDMLAHAVKIFEFMGYVAVIPEKQMQAATALCSCGLAFAMRYMRAAVEGAVQLGLKPADALRWEMETLRGACELLDVYGTHPEQEIDKVTTPGGITIRGLNDMEAHGFTTAVISGLLAAH